MIQSLGATNIWFYFQRGNKTEPVQEPQPEPQDDTLFDTSEHTHVPKAQGKPKTEAKVAEEQPATAATHQHEAADGTTQEHVTDLRQKSSATAAETHTHKPPPRSRGRAYFGEHPAVSVSRWCRALAPQPKLFRVAPLFCATLWGGGGLCHGGPFPPLATGTNLPAY